MPRPLAVLILLAAVPVAACDEPSLCLGEDTRSIIGGSPTPEAMLPAVGALVIEQYTDRKSFCTATLIADRLLVTAAHCIETWQSLSASAPHLELGFFNGAALSSSSTLLRVASAEVHPDYRGGEPPGELSDYHDLAIARLAVPAATAPLKLIRPSELAALVEGAPVLIAGYGLSSPYDQSSGGLKRHGTTAIAALAASEFRVLGDSRPQKCSGDSGGPTLLEVDGAAGKEQRLIGVASRAGQGCASGSIETRLDAYLGWLHGSGALPCGSGLSPECGPPPRAPRKLGEAGATSEGPSGGPTPGLDSSGCSVGAVGRGGAGPGLAWLLAGLALLLARRSFGPR